MTVSARRFKDRKRSTLRVRDHRHAADSFHRDGRQVETGSHFFGFRGRRIHIINLEVSHPVGWNSWLTMRGWGDPSHKMLAILDVQVAGFIFRIGEDLPSK